MFLCSLCLLRLYNLKHNEASLTSSTWLTLCMCVCVYLCVCGELRDVRKAVWRSVAVPLCFGVHIWALQSATMTYYPQHKYTFLTFSIQRWRTLRKGHCPGRRGAQGGWWQMGGVFPWWPGRQKEEGIRLLTLGERWMSLSWGKTGSDHNSSEKSEGEGDQQPCKLIVAVGRVSFGGQSEALSISIRKTLC